jgi:hypothetical protein
MHRTRVLLAALLVAGSSHIAFAQTTTTPPGTTDAKPSRIKLTMAKLKEMKTKWSANRPKLKACRTEVKKQGLTGDDRWFYIEDCMNKT